MYARGVCRYNGNRDNFVRYRLEGTDDLYAGSREVFGLFEFRGAVYSFTEGEFHYLSLDGIETKRTFNKVELTGTGSEMEGVYLNCFEVQEDQLFLCKIVHCFSHFYLIHNYQLPKLAQ